MFKDKNKYILNYTPDTAIPRRMWDYIWMVVKRNPRMWVLFIVMDIVHAIRYPLAFLLVGMTIDSLDGLEPQSQLPSHIWLYVGLIFVVLFIGEMAHLLTHYWFFDWWKRARAELRSDLFAYALEHSFTYFQNHFAGSLARKVSEGVARGLDFSEQARWQILMPLVSMSASGIFLFQISSVFGAIVCTFVIVILTPVLLKLRKLTEQSRTYADLCSDVTGQIVDSLSNIASVKSYAHEDVEMRKHTKVSEAQMKGWHKLLRTHLMVDNYKRMTFVIFGGGMMMLCIFGWQNGYISFGDMAAIMGIAFSFTGSAWHLSGGIIHSMESLGYLNDSLSTLIKPHSVKDAEEAKELQVRDAKIEFKNVDFDYGENAANKPVFEKLNVVIPAGQRVGLIGPSGAGKSTFINLIQRLFDVTGGEICIDGQNIAQVTQKSLRRSIAIIPQDTALFHRTIAENIRYGRLDASDAEVYEAAKRAHALEFIEALPKGFETYVGERGVKLSGGQRQRIAIARAILKDAPILILDEATSALDSESEHLIQESLFDLMQGKTVIAIAHRLSTIAHLDRLLVVEDGYIIEDGTHSELLAHKGVYARLWGMQSGGFLKE